MPSFSDLSPELLRDIAAHLLMWQQRSDFMAEHTRYIWRWPDNRDSSELKSLALVNKRCRDAAYAVLFNEARISSNEIAENLIASPHIHAVVRDLAWVKERRGGEAGFDSEEETKVLLNLLSKTKYLERLSIHHPQDFRVSIATDQLCLPRLQVLYTSAQVAPQNLLGCCPNLKVVTLRREIKTDDARVLVSRLNPDVTTLNISVKSLSVPLLQAVAKLKRLEVLTIETRLPHRDPWGGVGSVVLGRRLKEILRPLQELRVLLLGIAVCLPINMEEGNPDKEAPDALDSRLAAWPIAVALPKLEEISWMCIREDMTNLCGLDGVEEESEGTEGSSDSDSDSEHGPRDSNEYTATIVRQNGRVIVNFGEDIEDSLKELYGHHYPHLF